MQGKGYRLDGIANHGEAAKSYVIDHLRTQPELAWPIKILTKLSSQSEMADILLQSLNHGDVSFDQAIVDKNYDILCYLADYDVSSQLVHIAHLRRS